MSEAGAVAGYVVEEQPARSRKRYRDHGARGERFERHQFDSAASRSA